jgi:hypothetical protein
MPSQNQQIQLTYQVCPIILTGGAAAQIAGGMMPLLSITNAGGGVNLAGTILPFDIGDLDEAFATFTVLSGGTLVSQQVAKYPFANQSVAANATIREPLTLSVIMDTPMRGPNAWALKHSTMTALKTALDNHNNAGGLYTVQTPAFMYDNLILTSLTDTPRAGGSSPLPQNAWKFDFEKPLVTLDDAAAVQNQLTSKMSAGTPTDGSQSGPQTATPGANVPTSVDPKISLSTNTFPGAAYGGGAVAPSSFPGAAYGGGAVAPTQYSEGGGAFTSPYTVS